MPPEKLFLAVSLCYLSIWSSFVIPKIGFRTLKGYAYREMSWGYLPMWLHLLVLTPGITVSCALLVGSKMRACYGAKPGGREASGHVLFHWAAYFAIYPVEVFPIYEKLIFAVRDDTDIQVDHMKSGRVSDPLLNILISIFIRFRCPFIFDIMDDLDW